MYVNLLILEYNIILLYSNMMYNIIANHIIYLYIYITPTELDLKRFDVLQAETLRCGESKP